jgi:glycosyltransferase involved in cell wall biosynthesis
MRIALATESYWPNIDGGAVAEHELALRLAKNGHQVIVLAPANRWENYIQEDNGTVIHRCKAYTFPLYKEYKVTLWPYGHVRQVLDAFKPEVIHIHNPYGLGLSAMRWGRKNGVPLVGSNHLMPENFFMTVARFRPLLKILRRLGWAFIVWFYRHMDYTISPTGTAIDLLKKHGLDTPCGPASNGINLSAFHPGQDAEELRVKTGIPQGKPIVLYTGRLAGEKSLEVLIEAMPILRQKMDAHLVLAGVGREKEALERLVEEVGMKPFTTFVGGLSRQELPLIYILGDVFAIPSTAELQSIVTLEAMATGLPVVAADAGALPELCHDGVNGYLHKIADRADMAEKLHRILIDPELKKTMGQKSLEIVAKHSFDEAIKVFEGIYRNVL